MSDERSIRRCRAGYTRLLRLLPARFHARYAEGMTQTFTDLLREHDARGGSAYTRAIPLAFEAAVHIVKLNLETAMHHRFVNRPAIVTAGLLLIPLVMTFLDRHKPVGQGWRWEPASFLIMGALLFGAGVCYEFFASRLQRTTSRVLLLGAVAMGVFVIWAELAVQAISKLLAFAPA